MRCVARIAQSVEQGIENPRVLGSIPSPGTTILNPRLWRGFFRSGERTLHRTAFDYSPQAAHPFGASASAVQKRSRRFCPSPGTTILNPRLWRGFFRSGERTLHRTAFNDSSRPRDSPCFCHPASAFLLSSYRPLKKPQYCCVFICAKYSGCFFAQVQRCFLYIIYRPRPWTIDTKKNPLTP